MKRAYVDWLIDKAVAHTHMARDIDYIAGAAIVEEASARLEDSYRDARPLRTKFGVAYVGRRATRAIARREYRKNP